MKYHLLYGKDRIVNGKLRRIAFASRGSHFEVSVHTFGGCRIGDGIDEATTLFFDNEDNAGRAFTRLAHVTAKNFASFLTLLQAIG